MSPSTPAHPMLAALETRLYSSTTWRPASAADIASSLVDLVAELLAPSHVGNTMAHGSPAARTVASDALHSMARAQVSMDRVDTLGTPRVWVTGAVCSTAQQHAVAGPKEGLRVGLDGNNCWPQHGSTVAR